MFRAQLTVGDANFDLYNFVKMLDASMCDGIGLKGVHVPDLSVGGPGHLLKDFVLLSRLYPLRE